MTKSEIMKNAAEKLGLPVIDVPLSIQDMNDFQGVPIMDTSKMIFVFGSNTAGIHGAGAAAFAVRHRGAQFGTGVGHVGQSYALPTKNARKGVIFGRLPLTMIAKYVEQFLEYAEHHPELQFQVTCIGCGLAGLRHEDIAPMFATDSGLDNVYFDELWKPILGDGYRYWGTF